MQHHRLKLHFFTYLWHRQTLTRLLVSLSLVSVSCESALARLRWDPDFNGYQHLKQAGAGTDVSANNQKLIGQERKLLTQPIQANAYLSELFDFIQ
jgi:hypothetical protein